MAFRYTRERVQTIHAAYRFGWLATLMLVAAVLNIAWTRDTNRAAAHIQSLEDELRLTKMIAQAGPELLPPPALHQ